MQVVRCLVVLIFALYCILMLDRDILFITLFVSGGADLVFPHHQNEILQSEAYSGSTK